MVRDEGKYYTVIEAGHGMMKYGRDCFYDTDRLIEEKNGVFAGIWKKRKKQWKS